jgi:hypothetical protein
VRRVTLLPDLGRAVPCPTCGVAVGEVCRTLTRGEPQYATHQRREWLAQRARAGFDVRNKGDL